MQSVRVIVTYCSLLFALHTCHGADWTYKGDHGVDSWPTIGYPTCGGNSQSPIDLVDSEVQQFTPSAFSFTNFNTTDGVTWTLANSGHSVKVSYGGSKALQVSGGDLGSTYQVVQFHFHWGSDKTKGSEHTRDGNAYPMELHIVTFDTSNGNVSASLSQPKGLAVLGFFVEVGDEDNTEMATIVDALPKIAKAGNTTTDITPFPLSDFMTETDDFFRYDGSLTTPPCNEVVVWTVFTDPIKISDAQLEAFRAVLDAEQHEMKDNYRPVQALHGRKVFANFFVSTASGHVGCSLLLVAASVLVLSWV